MSLNIYTTMDKVPKDTRFVFDVEAHIINCGIEDNDFNRMVLKEIEKGSYRDRTRFIDRFGDKLNMFDLSTSSKVLICVNSFPNEVINGVEMGDNCGNCLFKLKKGSIYLDRAKLGIDIPCDGDIDVTVDGKRFSSPEELYEYVGVYL